MSNIFDNTVEPTAADLDDAEALIYSSGRYTTIIKGVAKALAYVRSQAKIEGYAHGWEDGERWPRHALSWILRKIQLRSWLREGRGSYEWDDDEYRKEAGYCMDDVTFIAKGELERPLPEEVKPEYYKRPTPEKTTKPVE